MTSPTDDVWSHHAPRHITEAESVETLAGDLAGLPRPVSPPPLPEKIFMGTSRFGSVYYGYHAEHLTAYAAECCAALVSERDALAGRVADLEAALQRSLSWLSSYPGGGTLLPNGPYEQARAALSTTPESKP